MTAMGNTLETLIARRGVDNAGDMPHPIASAVVADGQGYLVSDICYVNCGDQPANYALRGHPDFGTSTRSRAWRSHAELTLVSQPTADTWAMLKEAVKIDERSRVVPTHG